MFLETSRGKYVGFILALGVTDLLRCTEVYEVQSSYKSPQSGVFGVIGVYI